MRIVAKLTVVAVILLMVGATADARAASCRQRPHQAKCHNNLPGAHGGTGGGGGLYAPWPEGVDYAVGGPCGFFRDQGAHTYHPGRWNDDNEAIDFGICGADDYRDPVLAAHFGYVAQVGRNENGRYGLTVVISENQSDDEPGEATRYAHLASIAPDLARTEPVNAGEQIGRVGFTGPEGNGRADAHLHFGYYDEDGNAKQITRLGGFDVEDNTRITSNTPISAPAAPGTVPFKPVWTADFPASDVNGYPTESVDVGFDLDFHDSDPLIPGFEPTTDVIKPVDAVLADDYGLPPEVSGTEPSTDHARYRTTLTVPGDAEPGSIVPLEWHAFQYTDVGHTSGRLASPAPDLELLLHIEPRPPLVTITQGPPNPTNDTSATFEFNAVEGLPNPDFECKLDTGAFASCATGKTYSGLAPAQHTFQVHAIDSNGNIGLPASYPWTIQANVAPVATPTEMTLPGCCLGATGYNTVVPTFEWTATDPDGDGIDHSEVKLLTNGVEGTTFTVLGTSRAYVLTAATGTTGPTYQLAVRAVDGNQLAGAWTYGPAFKAQLVQESSSQIDYGSYWTSVACSSCSGGALKQTSGSGKGLSFDFTGFKVVLYGQTRQHGGLGTVKLNGVAPAVSSASVGFRSNYTYYRRVIYQSKKNDLAQGNHRFTLSTTLGSTSGDPAYTGVDAFVVFRAP